jgi:hypothetical protein
MTKTENTAVNRLIEQAHSRPLDTDDALFSSPAPKKSLPRPFPSKAIEPPAPLPRHRIPSSTQTQLAAAPPAVVARPADLEDSGLLQVDDEDDDDIPVTVSEQPIPADVKPIAARPSALGAVPGIDEASWYEESQAVDRLDDVQIGTRFVRRKSRGKSVLLLVGAFATGLVATAYIAWPSRAPSIAPLKDTAANVAPAAKAEVKAEPVVAAETTPAPAPAVAPAVAPAAQAEPAVVVPVVVEPAAPVAPAKVMIDLDSDPQGATVLLVEGSNTTSLGATPLTHELDPSRTYEVMFTLAGHKSALVTIDPAKSERVNVDLTTSTATAAPRTEALVAAAAAEPPPAAEPAVVADEKPAKVKAKAEPKARPARVAKAEPVRPAAPATGGKGGMLMLGAKPPCDIFIDGKNTGLKTPQREIKVAAGAHKITLVNKQFKITETFAVDVKAGSPTKVVKDLTKRMK